MKSACGHQTGLRPMQARRAPRKRKSTQTQRLMELFDSCDTAHRSELDVYQIGKYSSASTTRRSPRGSSRTTKTRRSRRTQKGLAREFVAFDKDIKTNIPELEVNQLRSNFELFKGQFGDDLLVSLHSLPRPDALHHRDVPRQRSFVMRSTRSPRTSSTSLCPRRSSRTSLRTREEVELTIGWDGR